MYESLHVAVKMYINYSFLHIYLLFSYRRSLQLMHCGIPTGYFTYMKNNNGYGINAILSIKIVFTVILIDFNFLETNNVFRGMRHYVQLLQIFKIVSINCVGIATLTFQRHMTSADS